MKTWKNIKPRGIKSRKRLKTKYGSQCFLDSKSLKYPICNKYTGKVECIGLSSANYYLKIHLSKAKKLKNRKSRKTLKSLKYKFGKLYKKYCK